MFLTMILKSSKMRVLGPVKLVSQQGLARSFAESSYLIPSVVYSQCILGHPDNFSKHAI